MGTVAHISLLRCKTTRAYVLGCYNQLVKLIVKAALGVLLLVPFASSKETQSFREQQLRFPRVRAAAKEKDGTLKRMFEEKKLAYPPQAILLRAFKQEGLLELWAANSAESSYTLVHSYSICATSGVLGPKRRYGDEQVPEGFYELDWFNPQSNFFLSLHVSYPNAADRILGSQKNLGGDIFLHGNCVTIGCIPITDDGIKEVYWLAVLTHGSGQEHIPIQIFPARFTEERYKSLVEKHRDQPGLIAFWTNLKGGFDSFEKTHRLVKVSVSRDGEYTFSEAHDRGAND